MNTEEVILHWEKYSVQAPLALEQLSHSCSYTATLDDIREMLLFKIESNILAGKLPTETYERLVEVKYYVPKTWIDAFILQYNDKWWMPKRIKPKYNQESKIEKVFINVDMKIRFPKATLPYNKKLGPFLRHDITVGEAYTNDYYANDFNAPES